MNNKFKEVDLKEVEHLCNDKLILIVTATDLETKFTHKNFLPLKGEEKIIRLFQGNSTYYFGQFGKYYVAHVQCAMGSISRDSSIMTVSNALTILKCKIVIMIGIAFGVDELKQKIGDVLVAESIIPYEIERVGQNQTINRGIEVPSSQLLLNRFRNIIGTWEHFTSDTKKANLIITRMLSGEKLVDNLELRNKLVSFFPDSKGGEMEGYGLYSACGEKIDKILIKGICDFADGNKNKNKTLNQQIAIEAALSACFELFSSASAFKDSGILPNEESIEKSFQEILNLNEVLFDLYDKTKENYYIQRKDDDLFNRNIKQFGIWIYGPTGCGKSNLILRNLINNNYLFMIINLAPCIGLNIESLFKEILSILISYCHCDTLKIEPQTFSECNKAIIELLNKFYLNKELVIFIEEIPACNDKTFIEFVEKIFSIIILKNFNSGLNKIKFVLSSIENPKICISNNQKKIHQSMNFIPLEYWQEEDIVSLINIIISEFKIILTGEFKRDIIKSAKGSPRFIKKFFRSIYSLNKADEKTLKIILKETERELY